MKKSNEYKPTQSFALLLQGAPKTGKTRLSMLFPRPYIFDADNNLSGAVRSLRAEFPDKQFKFDQAAFDDNDKPVAPEDRWERMLICLNAALQDDEVETVVLDSATTICDNLMAYIIKGKSGKDSTKMTIGDWIPFRNSLTNLITKLRTTKKFLILTAHEENVTDEATGQIFTRVNIPSKLADSFGGFFSDTWHTEVSMMGDQPLYVVRTSPTVRHHSIGNSLGLPTTPLKMTWEGIAKYLNQHNEEAK